MPFLLVLLLLFTSSVNAQSGRPHSLARMDSIEKIDSTDTRTLPTVLLGKYFSIARSNPELHLNTELSEWLSSLARTERITLGEILLIDKDMRTRALGISILFDTLGKEAGERYLSMRSLQTDLDAARRSLQVAIIHYDLPSSLLLMLPSPD